LETEHTLRLETVNGPVPWGHHSTVEKSVGMLEKLSSALKFPLQDMTVPVAWVFRVSGALATEGIIKCLLRYLLASLFF